MEAKQNWVERHALKQKDNVFAEQFWKLATLLVQSISVSPHFQIHLKILPSHITVHFKRLPPTCKSNP